MRSLLLYLLAASLVAARPQKEALCSYGTSNYSLSWTFDELSNDVVFRLTATSAAKNFWTGVYFGEEEPFDAIGVFVRNGQIGLVDAHLPPSDDATVIADDTTNVQSLQFDMIEGRLTAEFARPLASPDPQDTDLSKCATFFFPEAEEITKTGQITLPNMSMSRRVCDISRNCPIRRRHSQDQFKREDEKAAAVDAKDDEKPADSDSKTEEKSAKADSKPEEKPAEADAVPEVPKEEPEAASAEKELEKKDAEDAPVCSWYHEGSNASWRLEGDDIFFNINLPSKKGKWYSVFGIGESMENIRALIVFTENGKLQKIGAYKTEGYSIPKAIKYEPVLVTSGNEKGRSFYELSASKEKLFEGIDFSGTVTLQLGLYIGNYGKHFKIQKHKKLPIGLGVTGLSKCLLEKEDLIETEASGLEPEEGSGELEEESASTPAIAKENEDGLLFNPFKPDSTEKPIEAEAEKPIEAVENKPELLKDEKKEEDSIQQKEEAEGSGEDFEEEMNATPEPEANQALAAEAATTIAAPIVNGACSSEHKDLKVCASYFADYLAKVEEWANNHEQTLGSQMWKACTLLSEVKHVPTMCCTIFRDTCASHLKI